MMPDAAAAPRGPYAQAALDYHAAGWPGPLPLPYGKKKSPPVGWTGQHGAWPSYPDIYAWVEGVEGGGNIALRMPHHILGIDVDNYGDKRGGATVAKAEVRWVVLPHTWRTTSRDDGISGIRFYRVPEGLAWPGELGPDTELIQFRHRYAIVWPSIHPEGRTYRWVNPDGAVSTVIPHVDDLPSLPDAWVLGLTGGELAVDTPRNDLGWVGVGTWLVSRGKPDTPPCPRMSAALTRALNEMREPGSKHVAARGHVLRLIRLAAEGHLGVQQAVVQLGQAFTAAVTNPARTGQIRSDSEAIGEWGSLLIGAVNLVTASPGSPIDVDLCANPFAGLIDKMPTAQSAAASPAVVPEPEESKPKPSPEREHTSWWPLDLTAAIAGEHDEPEPEHLRRNDGRRLFYAGKVNGIIGESESGKTWLALLAVLQALQDGQPVLYLDFEDTAIGIVSRLRALGTSIEEFKHLAYVSPDEALHALAAIDLAETLASVVPTLVILDGFNAAMTLLGFQINDNNDATKFSQELLKKLSGTGAAVIYVDHLPKDKDNRGKGGIGAQAKRAMTTGCAVSVEVLTPFGRGMTGRLRIVVDKDRPGHVRAVSAGARNVGTAILVSNTKDGTVTVTVEAPDLRPPGERPAFRPTVLMERVCQFLNSVQGDVPKSVIEKEVTGDSNGIRAALDVLVAEDYVSRYTSRGSILHRLVRVYREVDDLVKS